MPAAHWVPEISFCSSRDGARLGFAVYGTGPRTVVLSPLHLQAPVDALSITNRHWVETLAPHARVVSYNPRGLWLSADESAAAPSLENCAEDLAMVVDAATSGPVVLVALSHGVLPAIVFAATQPRRVERIVILGGYARGRGRRTRGSGYDCETQALLEAVQVAFGPELAYAAPFRRALFSRILPRASEAQLTEIDQVYARQRMPSEVAVQYTRLAYTADISSLARSVTCPVLVLHARDDPFTPFAEGSHLTALIPGARLLPLEGCLHLPLGDDPEWPRIVEALQAFLGFDAPPARAPAGPTVALSPRQREVMRLVGQGHTDKEIARILGLSHRTVEMHVSHSLQVLCCRSRAEGVRVASERGLLRNE